MEQTVVYLKLKGAQFFAQLDLGLTIDQYIILESIYKNSNICQRDLAKLILKDRSNTSRMLNNLEEKGFIDRFVDTKGNRLVKKIHITEKGKAVIEKNQELLTNAFKHVFEDIPEHEFEKMSELLDKLKLSLSKTTIIHI